MKHEAFVDAVSMLDDDIIAEAQEPFSRKSRARAIGFCSAAAACAAVIGAILLFPGEKGADFLVMGKALSGGSVVIGDDQNLAENRAAISAYALEPTDIPISIAAHGLTVVTVSGGELYSESSTAPAETPLEICETASFTWSIPMWNASEEFTLTAQTGNVCRVLVISYDDSIQEWTAAESSR